MRTVFLMVLVLVAGAALGFTVLPNYISDQPSPNAVCNQQLPGTGWSVNLHLSKDINNGTRLVCERNDTQRTLTVNIDFDIKTLGGKA